MITSGLYLFLIGSMVNWLTLPALLMLPMLAWVYRRLALAEEVEFAEDYRRYQRCSGMFIPRFGRMAD